VDTHTTHAVHRARLGLLRYIEQANLQPGDILPSRSSLAAQLGVCRTTLWRAVGHLQDEGVLQRGQRRRLRLSTRTFHASKDPPPATGSKVLRWQRVYSELLHELFDGDLRDTSTLLPTKELARRFGVCRATAAKAVSALRREGLLKGRYIVRQDTTGVAARMRVILLVDMRPRQETQHVRPLQIHLVSTHQRRITQLLEQRCIMHNISFLKLGFVVENGTMRLIDLASLDTVELPQGDDVLGYLCWWFGDEAIRNTLLRRLSLAGKPISILLESAKEGPGKYLDFRKGIRLFRVGGTTRPGRQVGLHLRSLGHRRIAFFSPFHQMEWARRRYEGIVEVFTQQGLPASSVLLFSWTHLTSQWDLLERAHARGKFDQLEAYFTEFIATLPRPFSSHLWEYYRKMTHTGYAQSELGLQMHPWIEFARNDPSITSWVGASDATVGLLLEYFLRRNEWPDRTIIGFDNTLESLLADITSYHFDLERLSEQMIRNLVNRRDPTLPANNRIIEIDGAVVVRGSSRPVEMH
jgi:DNA-binding FadR family transcriptional regulator